MKGLFVWLVVYFAMIFWVLIPAFGEPDTFFGWLGVIVVSIAVAEVASAIVRSVDR